MSDILDNSYSYIMKNFIRFGMLLLLIGVIFMIFGIINSNSSYTLGFSLSGGFFFLSGIILLVSSQKSN